MPARRLLPEFLSTMLKLQVRNFILSNNRLLSPVREKSKKERTIRCLILFIFLSAISTLTVLNDPFLLFGPASGSILNWYPRYSNCFVGTDQTSPGTDSSKVVI